jgi:hypothetical protein
VRKNYNKGEKISHTEMGKLRDHWSQDFAKLELHVGSIKNVKLFLRGP